MLAFLSRGWPAPGTLERETMQNLLTLIRNNEDFRGVVLFDLGHYWSQLSCGTVCCLVGTDNFANHKRFSESKMTTWSLTKICDHYGLTQNEVSWLFCTIQLSFTYLNIAGDRHCGRLFKPRSTTDLDAALNRVRKFVYYKLHKRELCHHPDGRVRESARRVGDVGVCESVAQQYKEIEHANV